MRLLSICVLVAYMVSTRFPQQNSVGTLDPALSHVVAWVTDSSGRPVQDLSAEDFLLEANGVSQRIANFHRNPEGPVSIALMIDGGPGTMNDGSIFRELGGARIFRQFFKKKGDDISLITSQPFEIYDGMSDVLEFDRLLTDQLAYAEAWRSFTPEKRRSIPKFGDSMKRALAGVTKMPHQSRALILFSS